MQQGAAGCSRVQRYCAESKLRAAVMQVDLVSPEQAAAVEAHVRAINSSVSIMRTQRSSLDLALLLNRQQYLIRDPADLEKALPGPQVAALLQPERAGAGHAAAGAAAAAGAGAAAGPGSSPHGHEHAAGSDHEHTCDEHCQHEHQHGHHAPYHNAEVSTVSLRSSRPMELSALKQWLDELLWERQGDGPDIYRMKGVLLVQGDSRCHMLQAVYELYDIVVGPEWGSVQQQGAGGQAAGAAVQLETRIVVIGRRLDKVKLQAALDGVCAAMDA